MNSNLTSYYYGVNPWEARPGRPAYDPGDARNLAVGLNTSYALTQRWVVFANYGHIGYDTEIYNSPIVEEDNSSVLFIGAAYMFGSLFDPDVVHSDRRGEWSWRVNYAYQAEGSIVTDIATGDFSSSKDVDTNIFGWITGHWECLR